MINIFQAIMEELADILEIDNAVIGNKSRKKYLETAIRENKCLVVRDDENIKGFLTYHTHFFDCSFISLVIVHPSERRKCYGKALIHFFENISPSMKVFSSTNQSNEKMQSLFASIGYVKSGYVENLDDGDPEIIYFKNLEKRNRKGLGVYQ